MPQSSRIPTALLDCSVKCAAPPAACVEVLPCMSDGICDVCTGAKPVACRGQQEAAQMLYC